MTAEERRQADKRRRQMYRAAIDEQADRLEDAYFVLRGVSSPEAAWTCERQNYVPHGPLDGSLADAVLDAARALRGIAAL